MRAAASASVSAAKSSEVWARAATAAPAIIRLKPRRVGADIGSILHAFALVGPGLLPCRRASARRVGSINYSRGRRANPGGRPAREPHKNKNLFQFVYFNLSSFFRTSGAFVVSEASSR